MRLYVFFSVHERLFHPVMERMGTRYGVRELSGFVWGEDQAEFLNSTGATYDPLHVFTRDVAANWVDAPAPDLDYLRERENRYGVPLHRMLWSERHLLEGKTYAQALRLCESLFKLVEKSFDERRPDCIFSEDVSCLASYVHHVVAKDRGIPFWRISSARMPGLLSVYDGGLQDWNLTRAKLDELLGRDLAPAERDAAAAFVERFREKPSRPTGMEVRSRLPVASENDFHRLFSASRRYYRDPGNPTLSSPARMLRQRAVRLGRNRAADALDLFDEPVEGERYVLFPIHFQPEASTLVQAPYFLNQEALIEDISKSLPVGYQLYVKEHLTNRGRRPLDFYKHIKKTFGVRLLGPDADTWALIRGASAIAVITGTMGWEGLLFGKPVITFGDVFFNMHPGVYRASLEPKDRWYEVFDRAMHHHVHDEDQLLKLVSAIQQTSKPGFMKNPSTFPDVVEADNVAKVADALAWGLGLEPVQDPASDL